MFRNVKSHELFSRPALYRALDQGGLVFLLAVGLGAGAALASL